MICCSMCGTKSCPMKIPAEVRDYAEWLSDNVKTDLKRQADKVLKGMGAKSAEFIAQGGGGHLLK